MLYITKKGMDRLGELDEWKDLEGWILSCVYEHPGQFPVEAWEIQGGSLEGKVYDALKEELVEEGLLEDR